VYAIQHSFRELAGRTGAELVRTGEVWEDALSAAPRLPLYEDGNHPTLYGSYLSALMIYAFISGRGVDTVSFRPEDIDENAAQTMKRLVAHYVHDSR
jgi:hypothetical protein